jgi:hypothetical protein
MLIIVTPQAPMDNATVGHEDGGALRSPLGGAIDRQEVGDTGGDGGLVAWGSPELNTRRHGLLLTDKRE